MSSWLYKLLCHYCLPSDNERLSCWRWCLGQHCCSRFNKYFAFRIAKEIGLKNQANRRNSVKEHGKEEITCLRETTNQSWTKAGVSGSKRAANVQWYRREYSIPAIDLSWSAFRHGLLCRLITRMWPDRWYPCRPDSIHIKKCTNSPLSHQLANAVVTVSNEESLPRGS